MAKSYQYKTGYDVDLAIKMLGGTNLEEMQSILDIKKSGGFKKETKIAQFYEKDSFGNVNQGYQNVSGILDQSKSSEIDDKLAAILPLYQQRVDEYIARKKAPGITSQTKGILG